MNAYTTLIAACPTLPPADAWHHTPVARLIVEDIHRMEAEKDRLDARYGGDSGLSTVWWNLGSIEDALLPRRSGRRTVFDARLTVIDELVGQLEVIRDEARDAARLAVFPQSWAHHAEEYDAYSDQLDEHMETIAQALEAAR